MLQFPTAEQVLQRYDEAGIDRGVLLPLVSPEVYLPQSNDDIIEMAEKLIDTDKAYTCNCKADVTSLNRREMKPCNHREQDIDTIKKQWGDMKCGRKRGGPPRTKAWAG